MNNTLFNSSFELSQTESNGISEWNLYTKENIVALAAFCIIILTFIAIVFCCRNTKQSTAKTLLHKLLIQVLICNFIGKCATIFLFAELLYQHHAGNCNLIAFIVYFSDIGGLLFYSLAQFVSFAPYIPIFKKCIKITDNDQSYTPYLDNRKHCCVYISALIVSIFPFFRPINGYGHDGNRCYVIDQLILFICYRGWVYLLGLIFPCCSVYVWCKIAKRWCSECDYFFPVIIFPSFISVFSLPFELEFICGVFGWYSDPHWMAFNIMWGNLFPVAIAILIYLSFKDKLIKIIFTFTSTSSSPQGFESETTTNSHQNETTTNYSHKSSRDVDMDYIE